MRRYALVLVCILLSSCSMKPVPVTHEERKLRSAQDWEAIFSHQQPMTRRLSLYQAMARAVKYNLDIRVKAVEQAFALTDAKYTNMTMLPSMVAAAGYTDRNNLYSVVSPENPSVISTTEDRAQRHADLQFAWNALDFGVSYFETKQKTSLYLIAQERKRKMLQQVIRDTRYAYWRAWSARRVLSQINPFMQELRVMIKKARTASDDNLVKPADGAKYRAELWNTLREMNLLAFDLSKAEPELLAMINAQPGTRLQLHNPMQSIYALPAKFPNNIRVLEQIALLDRPELREEDYRKRVTLDEIKKAQLKMLPGIEITGGLFYDSNSFLVNNNWAAFGAKVGSDLLQLPAKYQARNLAIRQEELADVRRMALSMAIITQVDIAKLRLTQARRQFDINSNLRSARKEHYRHVRNQEQSDISDKLTLVRAKAEKILSDLRFYLAYSESQNAVGQLLDSVGFDPLHRVQSVDVDVDVLAKEIERSLTTIPYSAAMNRITKQAMK